MAIDVTAASECYRNNKETLIDTLINGPRSAQLFKLQTGIKSHDYLHIAKTEINFGDCGCSCDADDTTHTFIDREITVGCIKVEDKVCAESFTNMYLEAEVNTVAGHETLGEVGGVLANGFVTAIANRLDVAIWQGDTTSANANLNKFDGLIKILNDDPDVAKLNLTTITDPQALVDALIAAIPESAYLRGADTLEGAQPVVIMGSTLLRSIQYRLRKVCYDGCNMAIVSEKFLGFDSFIPNDSGVRFIGVPGMNGTGKIIGGSLYDLYLGTDMENGEEQIDGWWSQDCDSWRQRAYFRYGVQIAFPEDMYLATYTASGVLPLRSSLMSTVESENNNSVQPSSVDVVSNAKAAYLAAFIAKRDESEDATTSVKSSNTRAVNNAIKALESLGITPTDVLAENNLTADGGSGDGVKIL